MEVSPGGSEWDAARHHHPGMNAQIGWLAPFCFFTVSMSHARLRPNYDCPTVSTGKACIRGLRFPVFCVLGLLAAGQTADEILAAYPYLEPADIRQALEYAAFLAEDENLERTG
jgi:uncharacterized protein (DUF433 family)